MLWLSPGITTDWPNCLLSRQIRSLGTQYTIYTTKPDLRKALSDRKYFERLSFRDIGPDILMIGIIDKKIEWPFVIFSQSVESIS